MIKTAFIRGFFRRLSKASDDLSTVAEAVRKGSFNLKHNVDVDVSKILTPKLIGFAGGAGLAGGAGAATGTQAINRAADRAFSNPEKNLKREAPSSFKENALHSRTNPLIFN